MNLPQIINLLQTNTYPQCMAIFDKHCLLNDITEFIKQYDPHHHKVKIDHAYRPNKIIYTEDAAGKQTAQREIPVARLPLALQKKIVLISAAFLGVPTLTSNPEADIEKELVQVLNKIFDANKLDYKFRTLAKKVMSERQAAELWYPQDINESYWNGFPINANMKLTVKILSKSLGDSLYPLFDEFGDMVAFGRQYQVRTVIDLNGAPEVIMMQHFDLYTADEIYFSKYYNDVWSFAGYVNALENESSVEGKKLEYTPGVSAIPNKFGKIPIMYYQQPFVEWSDVQDLIDRLEKKISNHADANDYFDSPLVAVTGTIKSFAQKGEQGKLLELNAGADVKYVTWDGAPESMKMEIDNLNKFIFSLTHTPDISFENMQGLGVFSGVALKMFFLDAQLKACDKEEIFGEGVQRRINFLKAAVAILDPKFNTALPLEIKPVFKTLLPQNVAEEIQTLVAAVTGGILSTESAIRQNPLVTGDPEDELTAVKDEAAAASAQALKIANANKPDTGAPVDPKNNGKPKPAEPAYN